MSDGFVGVQAYCTLCGNRSARRVDTGELREMVVRMHADHVEAFKATLIGAQCVYCGGTIEAKVLDEDPKGRAPER